MDELLEMAGDAAAGVHRGKRLSNPRGASRSLRVLVGIVCLAGCSSRSETYPDAIAPARDAANPAPDVAGPAPDVAPEDATREPIAWEVPGPGPLPPSCGGTTDITGTTPKGPFVGRYVLVRLYDLCPAIGILVTDGLAVDSQRFEFMVAPSGAASSFEGERQVPVYATPYDGEFLQGTANLSMADTPFTQRRTATPPFGDIHGILSVSDRGVSLSGSFDSPACGLGQSCYLP